LESLRRLFLREAEPPVGDGPVRLADILDRGWMELFYQPKIDNPREPQAPRDRLRHRAGLSVRQADAQGAADRHHTAAADGAIGTASRATALIADTAWCGTRPRREITAHHVKLPQL